MKNILEIFNLKNKNAVIVGGAGILGSTIAIGLGRAGAKISICDISDTNEIIKRIKEEKITGKGYYIDVMDKVKINQCKEKILQDFENIDILVNAAGGNIKEATTSKDNSFFNLELSALEKVVRLNLFGGAILPSQIFGEVMTGNINGGSIINISSMNAIRPLTCIPGYSAAKAAVSNFTQWLAVHFAQEYNKKVRVNAIAPGFFLTKQNHYLLFNENGVLNKRGKSIILHTPMREFGKPDDIIGACIWLASEASRFVTGTVIPIDGGFNAYSGV